MKSHERGTRIRFFPMHGFSRTCRRNARSVPRPKEGKQREAARSRVRRERSARSLLAGRGATGGNESKSRATWESQIEQGACSKLGAALSLFFSLRAFRALANSSRRRGRYLDRAFACTRPVRSSSASVSPSGDIECRVNGTRSIRYEFRAMFNVFVWISSFRRCAIAEIRLSLIMDERLRTHNYSLQRNPRISCSAKK